MRRRSLEDVEAALRKHNVDAVSPLETSREDSDAATRRRSLEDDEMAARQRGHVQDGQSRSAALDDNTTTRSRVGSLNDDAATRSRPAALNDNTAARNRLADDAKARGGAGDKAGVSRAAADSDAGLGADNRSEPLRPGDVVESHISFWDDEATKHFRAEWHEVKAEFVDDPVTALTRAHDLLTDAVNELTESLLAERDELDPLRTTSTPDTESMRMAMRGYREFLDRILSL